MIGKRKGEEVNDSNRNVAVICSRKIFLPLENKLKHPGRDETAPP